MKRICFFIYGLAAYGVFLAAFLYLIGFAGGFAVPKTIDSGAPPSPIRALLIDTGLIALFVVQHTIMARPWFKRKWTRIIPHAIERSTFVLVASGVLILLFWAWQPIPTVVWHVENSLGRLLLWAAFLFGWFFVILSSFLIDHFDLFGVRQVYLAARHKAYTPVPFKMGFVYGRIRHPMMLGFLIALWATPLMTVGHLIFAAELTAYIRWGTALEERDLLRAFGDDYQQYRRKTSMILPPFRKERIP